MKIAQRELRVAEVGVLERDPTAYLLGRALRQHEPTLLFEREPLAAAMEELGAKGISVPDPYEPYQIRLPLYIGATTPRAPNEIPHWHPEQAECYVLMEGEAEMLAKYRWQEGRWVRRVARPGDLIVVQPEVCHWFRWRSARGLALVFKAPQRAGVGRPPNGKSACRFCLHYQRDCVLPDGFTPPEDAGR